MPRIIWQDYSPNLLKNAVVAFRRHAQGTHVGMGYRAKNGNWQFLEMRGHLDVNIGPLEGSKKGYLWIDPSAMIHGTKMLMVTTRCRLFEKRKENRKIPYGFSDYHRAFNEESDFAATSECIGLTCSTFVLALFDSAGIELVVLDTWPIRYDDQQWQAQWMIRLQGFPEHVQKLQMEMGKKRVRPEEVAGAAAASGYPVSHATAVEKATEILNLAAKLEPPQRG
jgi:hypothetical protein